MLGQQLKTVVFTCKGDVTRDLCSEINKEINDRIDMKMEGMWSATWEYPVNDKGGLGFTVCQPIATSFMIWDVWPELNGAYFFLVSCQDFDDNVVEVITRKFLNVTEKKTFTMTLQPKYCL